MRYGCSREHPLFKDDAKVFKSATAPAEASKGFGHSPPSTQKSALCTFDGTRVYASASSGSGSAASEAERIPELRKKTSRVNTLRNSSVNTYYTRLWYYNREG